MTTMKNPVLRNKLNQVDSNPAGNIMEEISQQEMIEVAAGGSLSSFLGNKGKYCTLTVECMPSCN